MSNTLSTTLLDPLLPAAQPARQKTQIASLVRGRQRLWFRDALQIGFLDSVKRPAVGGTIIDESTGTKKYRISLLMPQHMQMVGLVGTLSLAPFSSLNQVEKSTTKSEILET